MPRYYFHQRTVDAYLEDPEGADFPTLAAAHEEATGAARELMAARIQAGLWPFASVFEIADEHGTVVATMPFSDAVGEPVEMPARPDTSWISKN